MAETIESEAPKASFAVYLLDPNKVVANTSLSENEVSGGHFDSNLIIDAVLDELKERYSGIESSEEQVEEEKGEGEQIGAPSDCLEMEQMKCYYQSFDLGNGYRGAIYRTKSVSPVEGFLSPLIEPRLVTSESGWDERIFESNGVCLVLMKEVANKVFLLSGGGAYRHISKFANSHFGTDFLARFYEADEAVVYRQGRHYLLGNTLSESRTTRSFQSLTDGAIAGTTVKNCDTVVNESHLERLGLDSKSRTTAHITEPALRLQSEISLEEYDAFLRQIAVILLREKNFPISYMTAIDDSGHLGVKQSELDDELFKQLYELACKIACQDDSKTGSIELDGMFGRGIGDIVATNVDLLIDAASYKIAYKGEKGEEGELIFEGHEWIPQLTEVISCAIEKSKRSTDEKLVKRVLKKANLTLIDGEGGESYCRTLYSSIQAVISHPVKGDSGKELRNMDFFLYGGKWNYISEEDIKYVTSQYIAVIDDSEKLCLPLLEEYDLFNTRFEEYGEDKKKDRLTEADYNKELFEKNHQVIVAHTIRPYQIELADVIVETENNVYLFHNKNKLDSQGARDVLGQIEAAAHIIFRVGSSSRAQDLLDRYFDSIESHYEKAGRKSPVDSKEAFRNMFKSEKRIFFVAGITRSTHADLRESSSNLAMSLVSTVRQSLTDMGFGFAIVGLAGDNQPGEDEVSEEPKG